MQSLLDFFALNALLAICLALLIWSVASLISAPWFANRAWLLVMLKLVTPPLVAIPVLWWNAAPPELVATTEPPQVPLTPEEMEAILARIDSEPAPPEPVEIESTVADVSMSSFPWRTYLVGGLLTGSVLWWSLIAIRIQRFRSTLHGVGGVRTAPEEVTAMGREVARSLGLRTMPRLEMVDADWSPMLWVLGWTPRVILPRKLWDALDADQRRAVLAHEFAHYRRKDHWVRRLELFVLGLYWWLPVAWLARQQLRRAEEACCDLVVIESLPDHASKYAEALVETAVYVSKPRLVPLASGGATNVANLKRRLQMIFQPRLLSRSQKVAIALSLTMGLLVLPFGFVAGQDKPVPKEEPAPTKVKPEKTEKTEKPGKPVGETIPVQGVKIKPDLSSVETTNKTEKVSSDQIQSLKDEIELLQVQVKAKITALNAAQRNLKIAQEISDNTSALEKKGSISRAEVLQVTKDLIKAQSEMDTRQAELAEHEVRLSQSMRKLAAMAQAKPSLPTKTEKPDPTKPIKPTPTEKPTEPTKPIKTEKPDPTKPIKTPPLTEKVPPSANVEKIEQARLKALQELELSAKALSDLGNMTAKMNDQIKLLQVQLEQTQVQIQHIRAKQDEMTKIRMLKQQEAENLAAELQKLLEIEKAKKEKKPEGPAK